jgi:hypothetical protein
MAAPERLLPDQDDVGVSGMTEYVKEKICRLSPSISIEIAASRAQHATNVEVVNSYSDRRVTSSKPAFPLEQVSLPARDTKVRSLITVFELV